MEELLNNQGLLTESVITSSAYNIDALIIQWIAKIDPSSPVLLFLHEQIVITQANLVNVLGTMKEGVVSALHTMPNWSPGMMYDFIPTSAGVYVFEALNSGAKYVGSAVNLFDRTWGHFYDYKAGKVEGMHKWVKDAGGLHNLKWSILYLVPNFKWDFFQQFPCHTLTYAEYMLLGTLSGFMVRVLEKSLLLNHSFGLNRTTAVSFKSAHYKKGSPVDIIGHECNTVLASCHSLGAARYALGTKSISAPKWHLINQTVIKDSNYPVDVMIKAHRKAPK